MDGASPAERLDEVRARIGKAARLAGRPPESVTLIAVSKTHPPDAVRPLIAAGQRVFGENRVQEAQAKWPALKVEHPDLSLHLIGQLQSNKAEDAVALFDAIHAVDRPSLVEALARTMTKLGRRPDCFLQVNIGDEAQKGGCAGRRAAGSDRASPQRRPSRRRTDVHSPRRGRAGSLFRIACQAGAAS